MASFWKYWFKIGLLPHTVLIVTLGVIFYRPVAEWSLAATLPWGWLSCAAIICAECRHDRTRRMTLPQLVLERRQLVLWYTAGAAGLLTLLVMLHVASPITYLLAPLQGLLARMVHERIDFQFARARALNLPVYEYA